MGFQEKKVLIFVNPFSGFKQAKKVYKIAYEILKKTNIKFKMIETERKNFVSDYIKGLSQEEFISYDGIVMCSGDGLIHEYLNGEKL